MDNDYLRKENVELIGQTKTAVSQRILFPPLIKKKAASLAVFC